jgi:hypothetical protein
MLAMADVLELSVRFDRDRPIYLPGETVSGTICCDNSAQLRNVRSIRCKFRGKTAIKITRVENTGAYGSGQVHTYRSKFYHIKEDVELLDVARQYQSVLHATTLTFPFSFEIPPDTPPTFTVCCTALSLSGSCRPYEPCEIPLPVTLAMSMVLS